MTIHSEHPFLPPRDQRDLLRRFRGHLPAPVTVWTTREGRGREGLTVSSMMLAEGGHNDGTDASEHPAELLGLIDEDSDLWPMLRRTRTLCVSVLAWPESNLADAFARTAPAPGGPFRMGEWVDTEWGPRLADASWLGARLIDETVGQRAGWAMLVRARIEHIEVSERAALGHLRGRYRDSSVSSRP